MAVGWPSVVAVVLALVAAAGGTAAGGASVEGVTPELLAKARAQGQVQVIVTLRVAPGAPAAEIDDAKRQVFAAIAPTPHRIVHRLTTLPQFVAEASEETLKILAASPLVLRVQEPRLSRPLN